MCLHSWICAFNVVLKFAILNTSPLFQEVLFLGPCFFCNVHNALLSCEYLYLLVTFSKMFLFLYLCLFFSPTHHTFILAKKIDCLSNFQLPSLCKMLRENEWNRDSSPVQLASKSERIRDEGMEGDTAQTETALFCFGRSVTSSHCAALLYKSVCVCEYVYSFLCRRKWCISRNSSIFTANKLSVKKI